MDASRQGWACAAVSIMSVLILTCATASAESVATARPGASGPCPASRPAEAQKVILAVFGGGTRSSESIDDPQHRHIPRLWNEMVPRGTLFTNMRVQGKVVHPNCTAAMLTGHTEWDDNNWSRPVDHPTIFEVFRKARAAPDTAAWAFVYASILAKAGESRDPSYLNCGPNVVEPPTIPRLAAQVMSSRLTKAAAIGSLAAEVAAARDAAKHARIAGRIDMSGLKSAAARTFMEREFAAWQAGEGTSSHDAFLAECAIACMHKFAPDVLVIAFGEIDSAHYGSWSRYVEAIRRTDELTWRIWRAAEELPAYSGRTLLLVAPDHGRELEREGGTGFIHHSDFYTAQGEDEGCRRVWMLALGPDVPAAKQVTEPVPSTAVAATALEYLGLRASPGAAASVRNLLWRPQVARRPRLSDDGSRHVQSAYPGH